MKKLLLLAAIAVAAAAFALLFVHLSSSGDLPPDVVEIDRQHVARELGDAKELAKAIAIAPHFTAGRMDGFTLLEVKPGSVADRLGLRAEDLILSVGGIDLDAPEAPFAAYDQLRGLEQIDVKMMRGGKVHWFVVRVSD
jgi:type II secretory pathway component PulC